ncbi:DUF624 domain-containing protein [Pseudoclavibacter sp. JSM 162008]|uniref:DUF624 domain-containing protein n=1 Tax=Pseudoclavibacter sp. JSM 162008 TaxID=3229855 RepID=UPI0035235966
MHRLFDLAAPIWRVMATVGDLILLNVLLLLACAPVVTAGAGFTAVFDTARRLQDRSDDGVRRTFFRSFRANFAGATAIWAVLGPVGIGIALAWAFLTPAELLVWKILVSVVYLLVFPFAWAMQARFENRPLRTLRNAVVVSIGRLPFTLGILAVHAVLLAVTIATWILLPQALFPLLALGYPLAAYGATPLLERALAPFLR